MHPELLFRPLAAIAGGDPDVLRERLLAALRVAAASSLSGHSIEIEYDADEMAFTVREYVTITPDNLEAARVFSEVEPGDEIGLDVWAPTAEAAAFLGLPERGWQRFRGHAERIMSAIVGAGRDESEGEELEPWLAARHDALAPWRRAAWVPIVEPGLDTTDLAGKTYYGGPAWLPVGAAWPTCSDCGAALELLLHLDIATSPLALAGPPAYEVFQCTTCGLGQRARAVEPSAQPRPSPVAEPRCLPKTVVGWRALDDYSGYASDEPVFVERMARRGDKLGGWMARVQGTREEPLPCPACGAEAILLYQLDSHGPTEWMWGDLGRAWLGACPRHPTRPAYFWECS